MAMGGQKGYLEELKMGGKRRGEGGPSRDSGGGGNVTYGLQFWGVIGSEEEMRELVPSVFRTNSFFHYCFGPRVYI
jgi:hypothetical protein